MTDREKHIKNLSYIMDSMPDDACGDWRDSLAYAISSLKTDEAYQLMYEGKEIYTKDEVIAMFIELMKEIEKIEMGDNVPFGFEPVNKFYEGISASSRVVRQRIEQLKENK